MNAEVASGMLLMLFLGSAVGYVVSQSRQQPKLRLQRERISMKDRSIEELRNELAEDKKTNRKLRYQLAKLDRGSAADRDDVAQTETENTVAEVKRLRLELIAVRERLAERDDAMRVARVMIQEIRQQIEGSSPIRVTSGDKLAPTEVEFVDERLASLEDVTGEINLQR